VNISRIKKSDRVENASSLKPDELLRLKSNV